MSLVSCLSKVLLSCGLLWSVESFRFPVSEIISFLLNQELMGVCLS